MSLFDTFVRGAATVVVLRYGPLGGTGEVSAEELEWQLAMLSSARRVVALSDVGLYLRGRSDLPRRGAVVTFDAADSRTLTIATDALARHDMPATFFVASAECDSLPEGWEPLRALRGGRFDFGSRTVSGQALRGRPPEQVQHELLESHRRIEQVLEQPCLAVAYPGAHDSDDLGVLAEAGLAGYRLALSRREGLNAVGALEPFALRRVTVAPALSRAAFQSTLKLGRLDR